MNENMQMNLQVMVYEIEEKMYKLRNDIENGSASKNVLELLQDLNSKLIEQGY